MLLKARYVIPVSSPHIEDGAVLVRDEVIVDVGEFSALAEKYPEEPVRDFGLAALMPGFIDLHTHLEYSAMRGLVDDLPYSRWKLQLMGLEPRFDREDWRDSAMLGALEATQSGITTIADITGSGASAGAACVAGLRSFVYREVATMEKHKVAEVMEQAAHDIESWQSMDASCRLTVGIAPHAPYSCHPELFRMVADFAIATGRPVAMHLAGSKEEYDFVKYGSSRLAVDFREESDESAPAWLPTGVSPVRYVLQWGLFDVPDMLAVHLTQLDEDDIDVLASKDVAVAHCPRCNAKLAMGLAPLSKFIAAGLRVGLGTDSPAASNSTDMFEEMRVGLLVQRSILGEDKWLPARQFIRLATLDAARALRIDHLVGSIEAGKQADIIAVDLSLSHQVPTHNPYSTLIYTANQENVLFTMVAGDVLYDRGTWATLDAERLLARAEEMRLKLRA
jgi:5-methylthioadenosine/S-adenosylhomocysteine deaminase